MGRSLQVRTRLRARGVLGRGFAVALLAAAVTTGCGGSSHKEASHNGASHGAEGHGGEAAAALPPPTPDTTPIEALRTPAGLVLKIAPAMTPATTPATPAASTTGTTTPASTPALTPPPSK